MYRVIIFRLIYSYIFIVKKRIILNIIQFKYNHMIKCNSILLFFYFMIYNISVSFILNILKNDNFIKI